MEGAADTLLHHFRQQSKEFGFRCEAGLPPEAMGCIGRVFRSGEVRCTPCLNNLNRIRALVPKPSIPPVSAQV